MIDSGTFFDTQILYKIIEPIIRYQGIKVIKFGLEHKFAPPLPNPSGNLNLVICFKYALLILLQNLFLLAL